MTPDAMALEQRIRDAGAMVDPIQKSRGSK